MINIIQTITVIFSQIDSNKTQSRFYLSTAFEVEYQFSSYFNLPQRFTVMISAKLRCHVSSAVSHNIRIADVSEDWKEKCCTVVAWCKQRGDLSIILTECKRKDFLNIEQRTKRQFFGLAQDKASSWIETIGSCMKLRKWPAFDLFDLVFQW